MFNEKIIRLHPDDVVIMLGSVHDDRTANIQTIADWMRCILHQAKEANFVALFCASRNAIPTTSGPSWESSKTAC